MALRVADLPLEMSLQTLLQMGTAEEKGAVALGRQRQQACSASDLYRGNNMTLQEALKPMGNLSMAVQGNTSHLLPALLVLKASKFLSEHGSVGIFCISRFLFKKDFKRSPSSKANSRHKSMLRVLTLSLLMALYYPISLECLAAGTHGRRSSRIRSNSTKAIRNDLGPLCDAFQMLFVGTSKHQRHVFGM